MKKHQKLAYPLIVIGTNSIAAYLIAHLFEDVVESSFRIHLGSVLNVFGSALEPIFLGALSLGAYWLILFWMYRHKVLIRI